MLGTAVVLTATACGRGSSGERITGARVQDGVTLITTTRRADVRLTTDGFDSIAVVAPDSAHVAILRRTRDTTAMPEDVRDIWIAAAGDAAARPLLAGRADDTPERNLLDIADLRWTADGRRLLFRTSAWTVSGAVHSVDLAANTERFLSPGTVVEVVGRGPYTGGLLVATTGWATDRGRYDLLAVLDSTGRRMLTFEGGYDSPAFQHFRDAYLATVPVPGADAEFHRVARPVPDSVQALYAAAQTPVPIPTPVVAPHRLAAGPSAERGASMIAVPPAAWVGDFTGSAPRYLPSARNMLRAEPGRVTWIIVDGGTATTCATEFAAPTEDTFMLSSPVWHCDGAPPSSTTVLSFDGSSRTWTLIDGEGAYADRMVFR